MVRYRRNFVEGGTYFFTATLADRGSSVLVWHAGFFARRLPGYAAGASFCDRRGRGAARPPSCRHDAAAGRCGLSESVATDQAAIYGRRGESRGSSRATGTESTRSGSGDFGSILTATIGISSRTSITSISIRSSTALWRACATGRTRRFIVTSGAGCCPRIGAEMPARIRRVSANGAADPGFRSRSIRATLAASCHNPTTFAEWPRGVPNEFSSRGNDQRSGNAVPIEGEIR